MKPFRKILFVLILLFSVISLSAMPDVCCDVNSDADSGIPKSVKRVLEKNSSRDEKMLLLTGNDSLTKMVLDRHSLVVGSQITMVTRRDVYSWITDHIKVSAALTRLLGNQYEITPGTLYDYHGVDGNDIAVDFNTAYYDSTSTVYIGKGKVKIFHIPVAGSFINYLEYYNKDDTHIVAQNCMYIMLNSSVKRFFVNIILAVSDVEEGIMDKLFALDNTVIKLIMIFMEDPHLYEMLQNPEAAPPENASEIAVKMKNAVVRESSIQDARELGRLIEKARHEVGK
jgi:hypothetical protein